jgi:hypothetical protein
MGCNARQSGSGVKHLKDAVRLKGEVAMHLKDAKQLYYTEQGTPINEW